MFFVFLELVFVVVAKIAIRYPVRRFQRGSPRWDGVSTAHRCGICRYMADGYTWQDVLSAQRPAKC